MIQKEYEYLVIHQIMNGENIKTLKELKENLPVGVNYFTIKAVIGKLKKNLEKFSLGEGRNNTDVF